MGIKDIRGKYVNVVPLNGLYNPQIGDKIIARVYGKTPVKYIMDINSKYIGILKPMDAVKRSSRPNQRGRTMGTYRLSKEDAMRSFNMGDLI